MVSNLRKSFEVFAFHQYGRAQPFPPFSITHHWQQIWRLGNRWSFFYPIRSWLHAYCGQSRTRFNCRKNISKLHYLLNEANITFCFQLASVYNTWKSHDENFFFNRANRKCALVFVNDLAKMSLSNERMPCHCIWSRFHMLDRLTYQQRVRFLTRFLSIPTNMKWATYGLYLDIFNVSTRANIYNVLVLRYHRELRRNADVLLPKWGKVSKENVSAGTQAQTCGIRLYSTQQLLCGFPPVPT